MNAIIQVGPNEYSTNNGRGTDLILSKNKWDRWEVVSFNAATQAYNGNFGGLKMFNSLEEVEKNYKAFRGIKALVELAVAA